MKSLFRLNLSASQVVSIYTRASYAKGILPALISLGVQGAPAWFVIVVGCLYVAFSFFLEVQIYQKSL